VKKRNFVLVFIVSMLFLVSCGMIDSNDEISTEITPDGTILRGSTLSAQLNWLYENAESHDTYILEVRNNQNISSRTLDYGGRDSVIVVIRGIGGNQKILSSRGNLFKINSGVILVLDNDITLDGQNQNSDCLVNIYGGTFIMNIGSTITNNGRSAVYVGSGNFEMTGGTIKGNAANIGGGVLVGNGTFNMTGGTISGNIAGKGGGVFVERNGTFIMRSGNITDNIAREYGGGVFIERGTFDKTRGIITGFADDQTNGNMAKDSLGNILTNRGHAVYLDNLSPRHRETTVTRTDSLSSNSIYGWDN